MRKLLALSVPAWAQEEAAPAVPAGDTAAAPGSEAAPAPAAAPAATPAAGDYVSRSLTLGTGTLQVTVPIVLNLSKDAVLKPVWVPLDLRYGVNDQLEVFVSHTGPGTAIATGGSPLGGGGGGVCIGGTDRGCPKFYNNINVGAQYSLMKSGGIELTGIGALEFRQLSDPMELAIDVGVGFKYISAPIAIRATPVIGIGVNNRDVGNKEYISVPVQVAFQASAPLAVFLDTGIFGPTSSFGDFYTVPVGVGVSYAVQAGLDVGAEILLPMVAKGSAIPGGAADYRQLGLFVAYRTK